MKVYLIGSLRDDKVPFVAECLRREGIEVFDDWYAAGPEADDYWKRYETARGHDLVQALQGHAAKHVFAFDKRHLDSCDAGVLVSPAGRSAHLELGYLIGKGKPTAIIDLTLATNTNRWDVMYQFAGLVTGSVHQVAEYLKGAHIGA